MAKECLQGCSVIQGIHNNTDLLNALPDRHAAGLQAAIKATNDCQGPGEIAVEYQEGILLWAKTVTEIQPACGYFDSPQNQ